MEKKERYENPYKNLEPCKEPDAECFKCGSKKELYKDPYKKPARKPFAKKKSKLKRFL
jgi:hypothetical protein